MTAPSLILDANLLILLVAGLASRTYITRHKRLSKFTEEDFDLLLEILGGAPGVILLPNTLTEASNLLAHIGEPAKGHIFRVFKEVISHGDEDYVSSARAASRPEFIRFGLTDAALLEALSTDVMLLTTDLDLYVSALSVGAQACNFNHLRDL